MSEDFRQGGDNEKKTFRVTISDEDYVSGSSGYGSRNGGGNNGGYYQARQPQRRDNYYGGQNQPRRGNAQQGYQRPRQPDQQSVRSSVPARTRQPNMTMQEYARSQQPQLTRTRTVTTRTGEHFEIPEETAIPPKVMRRNSKNTKSRGCVIALVYAAIVCSISALLSFYMIVGLNDMFGLVKEEQEITVDIPENAELDDVVKILDENGIVEYPFFFRLYAKISNDSTFKTGTFVLNTKSDYDRIVQKLTRPSTSDGSIVHVTIQEGLTVEEIAQKMDDYCVCTKEAFLYSVQNADFSSYDFVNYIPQDENRIYRLEGYLFPETYDFYIWGGSKHALNKLLSTFEAKVLSPSDLSYKTIDSNKKLSADDKKKKKTELGKKIDNYLRLAAVVEREVPTKADMEKVASVFYNRINKPNSECPTGKLESDATRWYPFATSAALKESEELTAAQKNTWIEDHKGAYVRKIIVDPWKDDSGFTETEFDTSLYDTYVNKGLPVGPICCPGLNAIKAAISPAKTKYYFFYSINDKETLFAETYSEHQSNIRKGSK